MDFRKAFDLIFSLFTAEAIPFAIAGGLAMQAYGRARATFDIDVVVPLSKQDRIVGFLVDSGYETLHLSEGFSNHLHPDRTLGRIDLIYVTGDTETRIMAASRPVLIAGTASYPVISPEHLAAMKLFAMKNDPNRRLQEMMDIRHLVEASPSDRAAIRRQFEKYGMEKELDEVFRGL